MIDFQSMCDTGDFEDIQVGDYKTIELTTGETVVMQIAGIDTYAGYDDIVHHIDWISKDCLETELAWNNTSGTNNGSVASSSPYIISNIYTYLANEVLPTLPDEVQEIIINKALEIETRYSSGETLTDSTSAVSRSLGYLWIPTEYEIFGSVMFETKLYSTGNQVQYPLFNNNIKARIKGVGNGGDSAFWWSATAASGFSYIASGVEASGRCYGWQVYNTVGYIPLCFRIATTS